MHLSALLHTTEALLWCSCLFLSLSGWGAAVLRLGGLRRPPFSFAATAGICLSVLAGGLLNLVHGIISPLLWMLVAFGLLLFLWLRPTCARPEHAQPAKPSRLAAVLLVLFALVLGIRLLATVRIDNYQNGDDYAFYLAEPEKTLQLHTYAPDPYSERRIINTIGGSYFLQDLVLSALPVENLQMADRFLGLILLGLLGFTLAEELALNPAQSAFLAFSLVLVPQLMFNLTMVVLPSALFLAMVALAASRLLREQHPTLQAILLGATAGAAISTKSNYIVHAVLLLLAFAIVRWISSGPRAALRLFTLSALAAFVVLSPWMIANRTASGTFFYPLFGHGYHYTAYHLLPSPSAPNLHLFLTKIVPFTGVLIVFAFLQGLAVADGTRDEATYAPLALSIASVAACLVLGLATGGDSLRRYNYPAIVPALLLLFASVAARLQQDPRDSRWRLFQNLAAAFSLAFALYIGLNSWTHEFAHVANSIHDTLTGRTIVPPAVAANYAAIERALPSGAPAIVTTHYNFLFDFRARTLYLADFAGAAGPPPGWPAFSSGDTLASYLLAHGIRYLVFEYNYPDFVPGAYETQQAADPALSRIIRNEALLGMNAHRQYRELAHTRRKLYDDGNTFILDLASPATVAANSGDK